MAHQQWTQFNCYRVLGVPANASPSEIHKAYTRASKINHPDVGGSEEAQKRINLAYEVLSDPIQRNSHDAVWIRPTYTRPTPPRPAPPPYPHKTGTWQPRPGKAEPTQEARAGRVSLGGLRNRIEAQLDSQRAAIWGDLEKRFTSLNRDFHQRYRQGRQSIVYYAVVAAGLLFFVDNLPILWVAILILAYSVLSGISGISIQGRKFSPIRTDALESLTQYAREKARESCAKDVAKLDRHLHTLASVSELLLRSSSFDDSEEQVARRLAAAFFLMGYTPEAYDRDARILIFSADDERLAVRFRHRTGAATNITYVRRHVRLMQLHRARQGYLFCTPGLSGNASAYAAQNRIKWYSLKTMNSWLNQVLESEYSGPEGNILDSLDRLQSFIGSIARPIPRRARSYRY